MHSIKESKHLLFMAIPNLLEKKKITPQVDSSSLCEFCLPEVNSKI